MSPESPLAPIIQPPSVKVGPLPQHKGVGLFLCPAFPPTEMVTQVAVRMVLW